MIHSLKIFRNSAEASEWCAKNVIGECSVLTPGKVWHWIHTSSKLVFRKSYAQRNLY